MKKITLPEGVGTLIIILIIVTILLFFPVYELITPILIQLGVK